MNVRGPATTPRYRYTRAGLDLPQRACTCAARAPTHQRCRPQRARGRPRARRRSVDDVDYFGNPVDHLRPSQEPHPELTITAASEVEVEPRRRHRCRTRRRPGRRVPSGWPRDSLGAGARRPASSSSSRPTSRASSDLAGYAAPRSRPGRPLLEAALDLTTPHPRRLQLRPGATTSHAGRRGARTAPRRLPGLRAPADRAACARSASRRATSAATCCTRPPPGSRELRRRRRLARLALGLLPGLGWIDLDPTNDLVPGDSTSRSPGAATTATSARSRA